MSVTEKSGQRRQDLDALAARIVQIVLGACDHHGPISPNYAQKLVRGALADWSAERRSPEAPTTSRDRDGLPPMCGAQRKTTADECGLRGNFHSGETPLVAVCVLNAGHEGAHYDSALRWGFERSDTGSPRTRSEPV